MHSESVRLLEFEAMVLMLHQLRMDRCGAVDDLERSGYLVLNWLRARGPLSISELSESFSVDNSTVYRQTATLLRLGLVERISDPGGGMARKFRVTPSGDRSLDRARHRRTAMLREFLGDWDIEEIADFASRLARFNAEVERYRREQHPAREATESEAMSP
ncbi:MarR family winged helix-turn-helix transcriptional regulator [Nocardia bovistercoris]|uniref:MarR family transcriptional regulator n=1 Tax=Nocardia bovistercoris TaxID=2785916 RepID=A0A931IHN4_9NOCA|nr:MarR family transcriptional regulator [Nocardia bovistercoris]MBH0779808.1 MarR family transcriptional regulator [Nocardia bovistercoris]